MPPTAYCILPTAYEGDVTCAFRLAYSRSPYWSRRLSPPIRPRCSEGKCRADQGDRPHQGHQGHLERRRTCPGGCLHCVGRTEQAHCGDGGPGLGRKPHRLPRHGRRRGECDRYGPAESEVGPSLAAPDVGNQQAGSERRESRAHLHGRLPSARALPVVLNGQVIGAMGVSSADGEKCAQSAIDTVFKGQATTVGR